MISAPCGRACEYLLPTQVYSWRSNVMSKPGDRSSVAQTYKIVVVGGGGVGKSAITIQFIQVPHEDDKFNRLAVIQFWHCVMHLMLDSPSNSVVFPILELFIAGCWVQSNHSEPCANKLGCRMCLKCITCCLALYGNDLVSLFFAELLRDRLRPYH